MIVYSFLGYTLMENEYCTGGQYDGTGFDGTIFNTVRYASLNEAVSVCNEIEECGCVWHDGCGDVFNVAEGSGTSSSTSYSTCDIPTNSYVSMIKLFQNILKWKELF